MRRLAILLVLVLTAPAAAQEGVYVVRNAPGWLGVNYEIRWVQHDGGCAPRVVVEAVVHGAPAERAGLRAGDAITAVNGDPVLPDRLQAVASRLAPGDSVRLRFERGGTSREVTAVADRRPARPLDIFVEQSRGYRNVATPVIEVTGDALVARNISAGWDPSRTRGFWVRHADGRTEYRLLDGWSDTEIDERVRELLACADSLGMQNPAWGGPGDRASVSLRRLQERADSLRVIINQRALERAGSLRRAAGPDSVPTDTLAGTLYRQLQQGTGGTPWQIVAPAPGGGSVRFYSPGGSYTFSVEEHVAVGLRGVAGAELTALEPELAEYFRNADRGLLVLRIAPDTPADRAGLRPGDVVIAADGRGIESVAELREVIALPRADAVDLRVIRRGSARTLSLRRD